LHFTRVCFDFNLLSTLLTGTFKKAKYVYHGKHSEGNRFIRNNDL